MIRQIPTINTRQLTLRAMRNDDFNRFAEIWADQQVVAYIGGEGRSRAQSWEAFLRNAGHWQIVGFGQWAIDVHRSRAMAGQVGFFFKSRGLGEDFDAYPEAGWVLAPEFQGKGLGHEATKAAHDWFDRVITGPTVCIIDPANASSLGVAQKLGYRALRLADFDGAPAQLMIREKPIGK